MFEVVFYRDKDGRSEISDYLDDLEKKSETDKNARVNKDKILAYMIALGEFGTRIGKPFVKHIEGDIWELRPLRNRNFFFYWKDNKYVLLHYFIKSHRKRQRRKLKRQKVI